MKGIRGRGFVLAAVGAALVVWVVVFAALAEVGNPQVLVGTAVSAGLVCLCPLAAGLVATRITGAESAARVRHVFVVLEGVGLVVFFPFYWFTFGIEPAGRLGHFLLGVVLALVVPVAAALLLTTWATRTVHRIAVPETVPDSGAGAPAQRIRVLGTVLVVAGVALSIGVTAVACTVPSYWLFLEIPGLLMTLTPVLLGTVLMRVKDVHSARRRNVGSYFVALIAGGFAVAKVGSVGAAPGMLFGALTFGAVVLVVVALLVVREYTADWKPAFSR
ncbi:hypothetical protein [Lentzea aerocolonigenes]|uniref:hypothetical protein n=1 Tax=Lentzea aerocolonigenes TaxID=68170 RepID=UPI0004C2FEFA|nr:hypothetical protein [Lentzea aerocolonigenes]MCP2248973.1 hypothetical protein [Lentzea aerocolonigenes]